MKILSTAPITNTSRFPFKKGTLQFLQDAPKEVIASLIKSLIGSTYDAAAVYVMSGVINGNTAPVYTISPGTIFYNGEVYDCDGANFTATGGNVGVFSIVQTQYTIDADPVTFTDLTTRNVHNIRKMQVAAAASGSGLANFSQAFYLSFRIPEQANITGTGAATVSGVYPNVNIDVPATGLTHLILAAGSQNIGDVPNSGVAITVNLPTTLTTSDYFVMGTIISNGSGQTDTTVIWSVKTRTTTSFVLTLNETFATVQNVAFEYIIFAKS